MLEMVEMAGRQCLARLGCDCTPSNDLARLALGLQPRGSPPSQAAALGSARRMQVTKAQVTPTLKNPNSNPFPDFQHFQAPSMPP